MALRMLALLAAPCLAAAATASPSRMSTELGGSLTIKRQPSEPAFASGRSYECVLGRAGQFSLHIPPQNYHETGVHSVAPGKVLDADTLLCDVGSVVTEGNTTVCVQEANASRHFPEFQPLGAAAPEAAGKKKLMCAQTSYAAAWTYHFALFAPAFNRRPYFREEEGALVSELDLGALAGKTVRITAGYHPSSPSSSGGGGRGGFVSVLNTTVNVPALDTPRGRTRCGAHGVTHGGVSTCRQVLPIRLPFPLQALPADIDEDCTITLQQEGAYAKAAVHTRRLQRSPPPADKGGSVVTFQVDHESQALLRDGVTFVMSGWFAGGYGHESAGLPPAYFVDKLPGNTTTSALLSVLGQASLTTQWGRDGQTFIRCGSWADPSLAQVFLEAAAATGVSVLWNVGADSLARAMARIVETKTNLTHCGTVPSPANWDACEKELRAYTIGNVTMVREYAAIGGYCESIHLQLGGHFVIVPSVCLSLNVSI
jgi:hypothetical protein